MPDARGFHDPRFYTPVSMAFGYDDQDIFSEFDDPERKRLIAQIHSLHPEVAQVPRAMLYLLWLADMEVLQKLAATSEGGDAIHDLQRNIPSYNVPLIWGCPGRAVKETARYHDSIADNGPSAKRILQYIRRQARERESFEYKLTGGGPIVSKFNYIIASAIQNQEDGLLENEGVWAFLVSFWGKAKVSIWRELLRRNSKINVYQIFNLINVDVSVCRCWAFGYAAVRPISVNAEKTEMKIAFHWFPRPERLGNIKKNDHVSILQNEFQDMRFRPGETPEGRSCIPTLLGGRPVSMVASGHIFTVKTDNKDVRPLPSFDLLELRWHLSRIAAFQGAADNEDGDCDYDYPFDPEDSESDFESGPELDSVSYLNSPCEPEWDPDEQFQPASLSGSVPDNDSWFSFLCINIRIVPNYKESFHFTSRPVLNLSRS
ncbi:unnamed protein product [Penicillium salamii]|nr:unnamed protein product [Penicillium salamii]